MKLGAIFSLEVVEVETARGVDVAVGVVWRAADKQTVIEAPRQIADAAGELGIDRKFGAPSRGGVEGLIEDQQRLLAFFA